MDPQTMEDDSGRFKDFQEQFNNLRTYNSQVRDTVAELRERTRTGTLEEYYEPFQSLLEDGWLSEELAISLFLGGLRVEIRNPVRIFKPRTLSDAYALVWLQELVHSTSCSSFPYKLSPPSSTEVAPRETQGKSAMNNLPDKEYVDDHDCNSNCHYHDENVLYQIEIGQEREESDYDYHSDVENEGSSQQGQTATPSGERHSSVDEFKAECKEFGVTDCSVHALLLSVPYPSIIPSFPVEKEISSIVCAYEGASFHTVHDIDFEQFVETKYQELHISLAHQKISNDYGVVQPQSSKGREASKLWSCKFTSVDCEHAELVVSEVERIIDKDNGRSSLRVHLLQELGSTLVQIQSWWLFWIEGRLKEGNWFCFLVLERSDDVAYKLPLSPIVQIHRASHVSILKKATDPSTATVAHDLFSASRHVVMQALVDRPTFSTIEDLMFELSMWRGNDEILELYSTQVDKGIIEVRTIVRELFPHNAHHREVTISISNYMLKHEESRLATVRGSIVVQPHIQLNPFEEINVAEMNVEWHKRRVSENEAIRKLGTVDLYCLAFCAFAGRSTIVHQTRKNENIEAHPSDPAQQISQHGEPVQCLSSMTTFEEDDGLFKKLQTLLVALEEGLCVQFWEAISPLLPFKWEMEQETKNILEPQIIEPWGQASLRGKQMILSVGWPFIFSIAASAPLGDVAHAVVVMARKEAWSRRKRKKESARISSSMLCDRCRTEGKGRESKMSALLNEITFLQKSIAMFQKNFWFVFFLKLGSSLGKYRGFRFKLAIFGSRKLGCSGPTTMDMKNVEKLIQSAA